MTVAVVGSLNLDLVVPVPRHPLPGETVLGGDHFANPGGKGANQAVAAARLGRRVAMVGRVGDDDAGRTLLSALAADGVDASHVRVTEGTASGIALITVDASGENAIVVSPGANALVAPTDVDAAAGVLAGAAVTLLQLEIPLDAVVAAARAARGTVVLNPAPARSLPRELLRAVDVLVPNRAELAALAGEREPPVSLDDLGRLAGRVDGPRVVVVTLGANGALVVKGGAPTHVPGVPVDPVDTTAAGDSFCGALADALARGDALGPAVRWAVRAAAITVTRPGAQRSMPSRAEVLASG